MTHRISRRQVASAVAAIALLAGRDADTAPARPSRALSPRQRSTAERILQREIDAGAVPGIGWSIGNARETLAEGAVGLRTISPSLPMRTTTRCALGSVSKQFTAACVFLLRQQGVVSLDAPLSDYLPEYRHARQMTLRQVLTMTSGIPVDIEACEAPADGRLDDMTLVEHLSRLDLEFKPGEHFAYSNCAYDLAGAVIAKISGMPFGRFVEQRIFRPLGMKFSYVLGTREDNDFAEGYAAEGTGWKQAPPTRADRQFASGNLASNPDDMQRWNRALLNAMLLTRKSLQEMLAVPVLASGAGSHYASGWFVEAKGAVWHGGTLEGYGTVNLLVPASGHAITLLGNTMPGGRWKPWEVAREIYNTASLGPTLPEFLPRVPTTAVRK